MLAIKRKDGSNIDPPACMTETPQSWFEIDESGPEMRELDEATTTTTTTATAATTTTTTTTTDYLLLTTDY